ncbi:ANL family adenylate-forming protein [Andreprevotia chitinilytica]|uniref:ANL family adenylate-forming protein n=1 Tax=Andreprevotia chitinilytica TaxID=396808 RepID=UPI0005542B43|nr:fatty acid--CoA ligase family protein [Andreprevotia chitinilytica]
MTLSYKPCIEQLRSHGERPFLHDAAGTTSYHGLCMQIERHLSLLTYSGVQAGQTVFVQGDYSLARIALFLALYQNGNIVVLNTSTNEAEIATKLRVVQADYRIDAQGVITRHVATGTATTAENRLLNGLRERNRAGLILFSSGTTGEPKAMLHDLDTLVDAFLGRRAKATNILLFLLFDHIGGINTLLNILASGASATLPGEKTPENVAAMIERYKVVVLPTSPTFLNLLLVSGLLDPVRLSSLRMITYGTEPMPHTLLARLRERLPRVKLLQTFGTSETGIVSTASRSSDSLFMRFDDGDTEHRVVNGELWLRSKRQILGYLNHQSDRFTDDGWYKTGDMVEQGEDGFLRIQGRDSDIVNVGGEKVFPAEVESILLRLPFIVDCKAYGQPNAITGQSVCVDVVLRDTPPEEHKARALEIKRFARDNMDAFKAPTRINVVAQLAYSARFKKLKAATQYLEEEE